MSELQQLFLEDMPDTLLSIDQDAFLGIPNLQWLALNNNFNLKEFTPNHLPDDAFPDLRFIQLFNNGFTKIR